MIQNLDVCLFSNVLATHSYLPSFQCYGNIGTTVHIVCFLIPRVTLTKGFVLISVVGMRKMKTETPINPF